MLPRDISLGSLGDRAWSIGLWEKLIMSKACCCNCKTYSSLKEKSGAVIIAKRNLVNKNEVLYIIAYSYWAKKKPVYTGHFSSKVIVFLFKTNLTLVVRVHQRCLPYLVLSQHLVAGIPEWELEARRLSPWQLARRACQDREVPGCKPHRVELQNCTHQPKLGKRITMKSWKCMNVPASLNCYIFISRFLPLSFLFFFCFSSLLTSEERCLVSMQAFHSF